MIRSRTTVGAEVWKHKPLLISPMPSGTDSVGGLAIVAAVVLGTVLLWERLNARTVDDIARSAVLLLRIFYAWVVFLELLSLTQC